MSPVTHTPQDVPTSAPPETLGSNAIDTIRPVFAPENAPALAASKLPEAKTSRHVAPPSRVRKSASAGTNVPESRTPTVLRDNPEVASRNAPVSPGSDAKPENPAIAPASGGVGIARIAPVATSRRLSLPALVSIPTAEFPEASIAIELRRASKRILAIASSTPSSLVHAPPRRPFHIPPAPGAA